MGSRDGIRQAQPMTDAQLLTTTEYAALASELGFLRSTHRAELANRVRAAHDPDGDHLRVVLEEAVRYSSTVDVP